MDESGKEIADGEANDKGDAEFCANEKAKVKKLQVKVIKIEVLLQHFKTNILNHGNSSSQAVKSFGDLGVASLD